MAKKPTDKELEQRIKALKKYAVARRQAEEALRESEKKYTTLVENSLTGIYIDCDGKIALANNKFAQIYRYSRDELIDIESWKLIHPEDRAWTDEIRTKRLKGEEAPSEYEARGLTKDGKTIWIARRNTRVSYGGKPAILGNIVEITDRKRAQEALRKAHDELDQRVKERTAELAKTNEELLEYDHIVAHILKAPLRAIHLYSDLLCEELEGTLKGNQKTYLDSLTRTVRQAAKLVDDLLEFSMIGRRSGPIEKIDIGVFLQELIVSLDLPSDVEVEMGNEWPIIEAEPALLQAIFSHLIGNAVKFNHLPRKRVELGWLPAGNERYEIFVRDNGFGIKPRYQQQIFHMFERLHTHEEYEGTGVGLAIVKKATSKLGGSVRVESMPGKRTTFFIVLPKTQKQI